MTKHPARRRFAFGSIVTMNRIGIVLAPLILQVALAQTAAAQSATNSPANQVVTPLVVQPVLEPVPAELKVVEPGLLQVATTVNDPVAALKAELESLKVSTESKMKELTKALQALQPPKAPVAPQKPKSVEPPQCPEEEVGEAAKKLASQLAGYTPTWLTKNPPNPKDLKNVEILKIKMDTWDGEIQIKSNEIETLQSALDAASAALKGLTRELDHNVKVIFSTRFELSKAQTKQNANAISYWDTSLKKLKKDRETLAQEVKNKQTDALTKIRRIAELEQLIANLAHDRNLIKSIVTLIESSATQ